MFRNKKNWLCCFCLGLLVVIFSSGCATNTRSGASISSTVSEQGKTANSQQSDSSNLPNAVKSISRNSDSIILPEKIESCFNITGRFSLTLLKKSKREQGNIEWKRCMTGFKESENEETERLLIKTLLGIQIAELRINNNEAKLLADNKIYRDINADNLLAKVLNLPLPFSKLSTWLQNRPSEANVANNIAVLRDPPWIINFEFPKQEDSTGEALPEFVNITDHENIQLLIRINSYIVW